MMQKMAWGYGLVLFALGTAALAQGRWTLSSGLDYSTGLYGESTPTRVRYLPVSGKYETGEWLFKLTVPRLEIDGPGMAAITGTSARGRASGLGDVVASCAHTLWQSPDRRLFVDLGGKVKWATASASQGLGTGENDYALYADVLRSFTQLSLLGSLGYRVMGDTADTDFANVWYGSVGAGWQLDARHSLGMMFDWRQASSATSGMQREYTLFHTWRLDETYKLQTYLVKGHATASPDWGGGVALSVSW